jgi:hypothetical protein
MTADYEIAEESFLHPRSRLGRARKRFVSLAEEVKDYANTARQLDRRFDAASGWTTYDLRGGRRPPKPLAEGAGAVCEDLRGALDAVIGVLRATQKQGSDPPRFPICLASEEYLGEGTERGKRRLLSDLRPADLAIVDSLQPYHRVKPEDDPLARLQALFESHAKGELKSVLILGDAAEADFEELERGSVRSAETHPCRGGVDAEDGLEVLRYRVSPDPAARLKVDIRLRFDLRFDPPRLTMSDLDRIRGRVEEIIGSFDSRLRAAA